MARGNEHYITSKKIRMQSTEWALLPEKLEGEKATESNKLKCVSTFVMRQGWGWRLEVAGDYPVPYFLYSPNFPQLHLLLPCLVVAVLQILRQRKNQGLPSLEHCPVTTTTNV